MAFVLTVRWVAKDGEEARVEHALRQLVEPSRAEPGCREYRPSRDPEDPRVFFIYEEYDDMAAYEAHGASEHFERWGAGEAFPLLASRERAFYETL